VRTSNQAGVLALPYEPEITVEEHVVLGVLVNGKPQSIGELHATLERDYAAVIQVNVFDLRKILDRLESQGLITSFDR